jgi:hypothetical protein
VAADSPVGRMMSRLACREAFERVVSVRRSSPAVVTSR